MAANQRILSLDILRGITVASMILVNNPAVWGGAYAPLRHADWHGLTPTDLIYPFFLFIMGVSAWFSLYRRSHENPRKTIWHIIRRSLLIFAVGVFLHLISQLAGGSLSWETFRIFGVLQGLAVAYLAGSLLLVLLKFKKIIPAAVMLLAAYWLLLVLGNGFELSADNIIAVVDRAVLGDGHMYHERLADGTRIAFEPESILSSIPRIAQFLLGAAAGRLLKENRPDEEKLNGILIFGVILLFCGFLIQYGCPVNKKIWSTSFALVTSGFAALMLGLLYWAIDMKGRSSWTGFFRVFGVNPLFLYALAWVLGVFVNMRLGTSFVLKRWFYTTCIDPFFGEAFGSLVYSLVFVAIIWCAGYVLDRKRIYIKL